MKQLLPLFLFLVPCLAWAQYPSNGNQKITLGEQTTADGLIYRGVLADTALITPSSDTSAYIILDTVNHRFYNYNRATNVWSVTTIGSISSGLTGVLPVANGGTGATSFSPNNYLIRTNSSGIFDTSLVYEAGGRVGIGTTISNSKLAIEGDYTDSGIQAFEMTRTSVLRTNARFSISNATNGAGIFLPIFRSVSNLVSGGSAIGLQIIGQPFEDDTNTDIAIQIDGRIHSGNGALTNASIVDFTNNGATKIMRIMANGRVGIGLTPTAVLNLKAGTATASTAPLKFTSQGASLLNPVEPGAVEFNGTNLLFTPSTARHTVNHGLPGSATLNFPSTNAQLSADLTITVTGAADGDVVSLGVPNAAVNANTSYSAWVSAANTVTVRFNNYSSGTVDPASALFKVFVTK
jgi:hypothetical protein